ncbi:BglG family transcription antiterminator [Enterococcus faecium]|uniref:BglG family transcription antiterminator n=2 Tax=Enterococcus TaxID=1350 RepID=UPI001106F429|nr:PTS sugar transporter subunit IIA [Enterococcus durans]NTQ83090.1 BglG family transcription antiterminator [Enterococcus faecium]
MLTERMLKTLYFLDKDNGATLHKISNELNINERYIRYDIEKINDFFSLKKLPLIRRTTDGKYFLEQFDFSSIQDRKNFLMSKDDRIELLLFILLIHSKLLNLNHLAAKMQVSRSTLKNDLKAVDEILLNHDLTLTYKNGYRVEGNINQIVKLLFQTMKCYDSLFVSSVNTQSNFENLVREVFSKSYDGIDIKKVVSVIRENLKRNEVMLSDDSFGWYFTNVMIVIWSKLHEKDVQFESPKQGNKHLSKIHTNEFIEEIESVTKLNFTNNQKEYMSYLLNYTSSYSVADSDLTIQIETITFELIDKMSKKMGIDFNDDADLAKGLILHMAPLIHRIRDNINITEDVMNILTTRDLEVYEIVSQVIKDIDILKYLKSDAELTYITIHFVASIRRIRDVIPKRILLVCGYGYGTSTMLKETLINDFHIKVVEVLPIYLLETYRDWSCIDFIISTTELGMHPVGRPVIVVNPIMSEKDVNCIIANGITRKKILSHYYSLNKSLEFLHDKKRARVLEIIRNEFGYPKLEKREVIAKFSDMIVDNGISFIDGSESWTDVVQLACHTLYNSGNIDELYCEEIFEGIRKMGYYSVSDEHFALFHGKPSKHIYQSGISIVISRKQIRFGEKKVNIVFCLASKDSQDQIPALISLVRMAKGTSLIEELKWTCSSKEAMEIILENERKIG